MAAHRSRLARLAPLAVLLSAAAAARSADAPLRPSSVFRGGVEMVHLHVTVTDNADRHVSGLGRRDFVVYEDGVPQELSLFAATAAPVSVVLMIDSSGSMYDSLPSARAAAARVVNGLRPGDRARVVGFSGRDVILQDFTDDRGALHTALDRIEASGATALYKALYVAIKDLKREKAGADSRRLAIVLLSDGLDTASSVTDEQILELARGSEVSVYPVALRPRLGGNHAVAFSEANYFLSRLASETGGRVFFAGSASELDGAYARIAAEMATQYSLAYTPLNARPTAGWRRIQVRAVGREGLQVRHRRGYYARGN